MKPQQDKNKTRLISKKLSYILRHSPDSIGLKLEKSGWVKVNELLEKLHRNNFPLSLEELEYVVENNDKKRFAFSADRTKIRASQGHSVSVELEYEVVEPPKILFHGTATKYLESIKNQGLKKQNRHHVHLSADEKTAQKVGARHGKVVILKVKALEMSQNGHDFYCSENGVWLTDNVPLDYLIFEM